MVLVIMKFISVVLLCSINRKSFVHNKSSSTSQFLKGKIRDLQKWLRYLSGIVTSAFKDGTGGCAGQPLSSTFPGFVGFFGVFFYFFSYSNDLPEALS